MNILVKISDHLHSYIEDVTQNQKKYYKEITTNGANPHIEGLLFERWVRPIQDNCNIHSLEKYNVRSNDAHFIYGWYEAFIQSNRFAEWMLNNDNLKIEVINK